MEREGAGSCSCSFVCRLRLAGRAGIEPSCGSRRRGGGCVAVRVEVKSRRGIPFWGRWRRRERKRRRAVGSLEAVGRRGSEQQGVIFAHARAPGQSSLGWLRSRECGKGAKKGAPNEKKARAAKRRRPPCCLDQRRGSTPNHTKRRRRRHNQIRNQIIKSQSSSAAWRRAGGCPRRRSKRRRRRRRGARSRTTNAARARRALKRRRRRR